MQIAEQHIELTGADVPQSLRNGRRRRHREIVVFKDPRQDDEKINIIVDQQNIRDGHCVTPRGELELSARLTIAPLSDSQHRHHP